MRRFFLYCLKKTLRLFARSEIKRHKPRIIGVTGSVGKTSTKAAIYTVFDKATDKNVRMAGGNLNNELGFPLAILGDYKRSGGAGLWAGVLIRELLRYLLVRNDCDYPDILILEYGADKPGDIKKLTKIAKPDVAVITAVGDVPVHVEYYDSPEAVAKEKASLLNGLGAKGTAVLNVDDPYVFDMRETARTEVVTFGFDSLADVRIRYFENRSEDSKPYGLFLRLNADDMDVSVTIEGVFGRSQAYAACAAAAVGLMEDGVTLTKIAEALAFYEGMKGRTRLIEGIKDSWILDDSYNASPVSSQAALEILDELEAKRKVAVLGDMLELGVYTEEAHKDTGRYAAQVADYIITVGARARFIAEAARSLDFPKKRVESFDTSDDAKRRVQEIIKEGDLVLVKGSQGMRMEKIVQEIMAEPERAGELLVRQYGKWIN